MKENYDYISQIKKLYCEDVNISQPLFIGQNHPLYIAETKHSKTVFRFSAPDCAYRNFHLSNLLRKYNIPVPDVQICRFDDNIYCEKYPFIEGKTLYERHNQGISSKTIEKVYSQLCQICYQMSQIPVQEFVALNLPVCKTDVFFRLLNRSHRVVGHNDLNDKNILLDQDDNVCAIIDLDSISLKPFEFFMILVFEIAQEKEYEYNVASIKDFCPSIYREQDFLNLSRQYKIYKKIVSIKNALLEKQTIIANRK